MDFNNTAPDLINDVRAEELATAAPNKIPDKDYKKVKELEKRYDELLVPDVDNEEERQKLRAQIKELWEGK